MWRMVLLNLALLFCGAIVFVPASNADPLLGLLGGENSDGLLGGLVDENGLLGLGDLLEQIFCILRQLGLSIVEEIVRTLGLDVVLGLNEILCEEGGDKLVGHIYSDDGTLEMELIPIILCTVKAVGMKQVNKILDTDGTQELLRLQDIVCKDGNPVVDDSCSCSALLIALLDIFGVDGISEVGLSGVTVLDATLSRQGIMDIYEFLKSDMCLMKRLPLTAFINLLQRQGLMITHAFNDIMCLDHGDELLKFLYFPNGSLQTDVIPKILCVIKHLGIEELIRLLTEKGLVNVLHGTISCELDGDQIVSKIDLDGDLLGDDKVCDDGHLTESQIVSCFKIFVESLSAITDMNFVPEIRLKDLARLYGIQELNSITDLIDLFISVSCLLENIELPVILDIMEQHDLAVVLTLNDFICQNGGLVLKDYLMPLMPEDGVVQTDAIAPIVCLAKNIGLQEVNSALNNCGLNRVLKVTNTIYPRGVFSESSGFCTSIEQTDSVGFVDVISLGNKCFSSILRLKDKLSSGASKDALDRAQSPNCLIDLFGQRFAEKIQETRGSSEIQFLSDAECPQGMPSKILQVMADSDESVRVFHSLLLRLGVSPTLRYIRDIGPDAIIQICSRLEKAGQICYEHLNYITCAVDSLREKVTVQLVDLISPVKFLTMREVICPNGEPLFLGRDADIIVEVLTACGSASSDCTDSLTEAFIDYPCEATCTICPLLQTPQVGEECSRLCESFCN